MLVRYFRRPSRIEQLRSSTGGHLLEGFAKELSEGRYQWVAARKHIRAAEHFLHWIAHRNLSLASVEERYEQQFLDHLKRCCCRGHHPPLEPRQQKYSVDLWFVYLRRAGVVPTPTFVEPVVEAPMLVSFCDWMRRQRGASDATLSIYRFELRAFIKDLGEDPHLYDARNLRQFVLDKSRRSGWAPTRKCICAIRMFLRFLISQGKCLNSLYASVPTLAHWRLSALPRYLQPDQIEQIIASADPKTPLGSRNRAILLLLARLGLRAGDVVRLRFSDVDWKEGVNAKTGNPLWSYTTGGYVESSPAVTNGVVYVGSDDFNVYALNASTGNRLWTYTTSDRVVSSPAVANGVVYIGSDKVYALNASTGAKLWSYATGDGYSSPAVANGVVYFGGGDDSLYALNASTGALLWGNHRGTVGNSSPAVANGVVYVCGSYKLLAFGLK